VDTSLIYAQTFVRRASAEKAMADANERTKMMSYRLAPQMIRLPRDKR
jgi:hypothetical protein